MANLQAALDAPTAVNVTVQAARRRKVRRSSRPREYLTEREIEKLMDAASGNRWGHRDATAILLAYRHGLRASELVALRWDDVDFRTGKLHVRRSKGGTASVHPIGGRELRALRRLQREGQRGRYVFTSERMAPLSVAGYQRMVARAGEAAGFPFQISSHVRRRERRSRRIGLRISGETEKNAPADANGRPFAGNGKGPPGGPQNNLGPIFAIGSTPRPYGPTRLENPRQALRLQNVAQLGPLRRRTEAHSRPAY